LLIAVALPRELEDAGLHFGFESVNGFVVFQIAVLRARGAGEGKKNEDGMAVQDEPP
jgi:hypothetical protein